MMCVCSPIAGYIKLLPHPAEFDTLLHWSDAELCLLGAPRLVAAVARQQAAWRQAYTGP